MTELLTPLTVDSLLVHRKHGCHTFRKGQEYEWLAAWVSQLVHEVTLRRAKVIQFS
jgi:hypothetical protein